LSILIPTERNLDFVFIGLQIVALDHDFEFAVLVWILHGQQNRPSFKGLEFLTVRPELAGDERKCIKRRSARPSVCFLQRSLHGFGKMFFQCPWSLAEKHLD
jgi:hypothetical protein